MLDQVIHFPHCYGEYKAEERKDCDKEPKCELITDCMFQSIQIITERGLEPNTDSIFLTYNKRTRALEEIKEILRVKI